MQLDKFNNPLFDSNDIFNILYTKKIDSLSKITVINSDEISSLESVSNIKFNKYQPTLCTLDEYDQLLQQCWFMPDEYKNFDIEKWIYNQCTNEKQITRVREELEEFNNQNVLDLLKWLKFFVDTCRKNKILWGVGRGSSVSSYVLYLIGVHRIDSIKYNLDWREFLR